MTVVSALHKFGVGQRLPVGGAELLINAGSDHALEIATSSPLGARIWRLHTGPGFQVTATVQDAVGTVTQSCHRPTVLTVRVEVVFGQIHAICGLDEEQAYLPLGACAGSGPVSLPRIRRMA